MEMVAQSLLGKKGLLPNTFLAICFAFDIEEVSVLRLPLTSTGLDLTRDYLEDVSHHLFFAPCHVGDNAYNNILT